jgi:HNH endonuclease
MVFTPSLNMKSKISEYITIDELRELFEIRGADVVWKTSRHTKIKVGSIAGNISVYPSATYRRIGPICKDGKVHLMLAHHIAFALHHGRWAAGLVDHRDGNGLNSHPDNLREATSSTNMMNRKINTNNILGVKGVRYKPGLTKPYYCRVKAKGKIVLDQHMTTLEEATAAVQEARTKHHGDFARHA